ncbi:MAG TPA: hypothetical protein VHM94_08235 [Acidimicrobiia bacterium]|nr:hypothetical protein [Acidimicrobiia bacterium]
MLRRIWWFGAGAAAGAGGMMMVMRSLWRRRPPTATELVQGAALTVADALSLGGRMLRPPPATAPGDR